MLGPLIRQGDEFRVSGDEEKAFYHVHWYNFPLFTWLTFLTNTACATAMNRSTPSCSPS